jgi:TonB family protein
MCGMLRAPVAVFLVLTAVVLAQNAPSAPAAAPEASSPTSAPETKVDASLRVAPPDSKSLTLAKLVSVVYPAPAQRAKTQGFVDLKITVGESGDVQDTAVVKGDPTLASAATDSVKQWKFQPFIKDGKPTKVSTIVHFRFAISDPKSDGKCTKGASLATVSTPFDQTVTVSQSDIQGYLCKKVAPLYAGLVAQARAKGDVVMEAVIGKDGTVQSLRVLSTESPLLAQTAIEAVRQWRYRPYLVSGEPVQVYTTIKVTIY